MDEIELMTRDDDESGVYCVYVICVNFRCTQCELRVVRSDGGLVRST